MSTTEVLVTTHFICLKINNFRKLINHAPYELTIEKEKISIWDGVFAPDPAISYSTAIILEHLPEIKDRKILDMGTGTGVIAIICSKRGAKKVVAVDNDQKAIENATENVEKSGANIELIKSDLYQNVSGKFDYIFANLPIVDKIWDSNEKTVEIIKRFLDESRGHLNPDGKIYLTWFSASDVKDVQQIAEKLGYGQETVSEEKLGYTWHLLILKRPKESK